MKKFSFFPTLVMAVAMIVSFASCAKDDDSTGGGGDTEATVNEKVNKESDTYLTSNYLWNTEYKTLSRNFTKDFKAFFEDNLMGMTTNTLDKKARGTDEKGNTIYSIYSYIEKDELNSPTTNSSSAVASAKKSVEKKKSYNFGLTGLFPVAFSQDEQGITQIVYCVRGIYAGSAAEKQGLKRGDLIYTVNGEAITNNNYKSLYTSLLSPSEAKEINLGYDAFDAKSGKYSERKTAALSSVAMECNPILYNKVDTIGSHRIGYLVYQSFDAGFDEELFEVFKSFKAAGVTDLVLDLRYNGGGYTRSANLITSCVAADACKDKVFYSLRYNDERMAERGNKRQETNFFYPTYEFYEDTQTDITAGGLGLTKLYVLVGENSASSSELVINTLRGIDIDVVLIGTQTEGKNVGMESKTVEIEGINYNIVPITFQSYNAKGFGDYSNGFTPEYVINEIEPNGDSNEFYNYRPFGSSEDPLYGKALQLITGESSAAKAKSLKQRKGVITTTGERFALPAVYRLGQFGMLQQ